MEEREILAKARRGDADAFEQLVTPYERKLYAVCLRMMASPQDAQDALQDAMLRMWRGLPDFDERSRFATWAYRVVTNTCLDALRKQKNRVASSLEALQEGGYLPEDPASSPEEAVIQRTREQAVRDALAELLPEARAALVLRDIQGESYERVAEALVGAGLGLVYQLLRPIVKVLAFPFALVTLGLLYVLIDAGLLWMVTTFFEGYTIDSFGWAIATSVTVNLMRRLLMSVRRR
jgi:RNA polymerase sigma-70 factor (ECF subfamily)